jgi:NADP-dependent 3-hydroxy acid dehydrogenase YdfG
MGSLSGKIAVIAVITGAGSGIGARHRVALRP